jgi:hypothetical protein
MHLGFRGTALAFAIALFSLGATGARAGDDGAAPLWVGIGSVFSPLLGMTALSKDDKDAIEYREHGKIVLPPKMDLPAPGATAATEGGVWPVNQETLRKKIKKEAAQKEIAGQGDARLRYTHPFDPNATVTVRAADGQGPAEGCANGKCETQSSSFLNTLNPLGWVGLGKKSAPLGPEPDREWLTDPPKGYRAPDGQALN